jgi:hypothetical protein
VSFLEKMRITVWVVLVVLGMGFGVATGASLFAGVGLSPSVAVFGLLATLALVATQIALHKEHPLTAGSVEKKA